MAKKHGMYGTSLTVRQIKSILKKTEALEKLRAEKDSMPPDRIVISYSDDDKKWMVTEHFTGKDKKNKSYSCKSKDFSELQEYVFQENFYGNVMMDLMEYLDGNLYSFDAGMFRVEHGLMNKAFSLEYVGHTERLTSEFNVNVFEEE